MQVNWKVDDDDDVAIFFLDYYCGCVHVVFVLFFFVLSKNEVDKFMMMQFCIRDTSTFAHSSQYQFKNPIQQHRNKCETLNATHSRTLNVIGFEIYFMKHKRTRTTRIHTASW